MKKQFTYIFISVLVLGTLLIGSSVLAAYGLDETAGAAGLKKYGGSVPVLIGNVIGAGLSMVSVVFFALMIYGGIRYMLARGNEEDTKKAIGTIWAAVIGILIVLASYALTQFVFSSLGAGAGGGGGVGDGGGGGTTNLPLGVAGGWCLVEGECVQGSGSPCPGQLFGTSQECAAALGTGGGTTPPGGGTTPPPPTITTCVPVPGADLIDYCEQWTKEKGNLAACPIANNHCELSGDIVTGYCGEGSATISNLCNATLTQNNECPTDATAGYCQPGT